MPEPPPFVEPGPPPDETTATVAQVIGRAGLAGVPLFGGPAIEVLNAIIEPTLERRKAAWFVKLAEAITELQMRLGDVEAALTDDELFVTMVREATRIAGGTAFEEKLEMLKACIVNGAVPDRPADFIALRFLRFVEELEPEHFRVLSYVANALTHFRAATPDYERGAHLIELGLPDAARRIVLRDLHDRRLLETTDPGPRFSSNSPVDEDGPSGTWTVTTTTLGFQLLQFVTLM